MRFESMGEFGRALASWLVSHGVTEDICGTTLETKWLRGADVPGRGGRPTLKSVTDSFPVSEKGSGVRRNAGGNSTIPAAAQPGSSRRPNKLLLAAFALVALCAGAGATFALAGRGSRPAAAPAQASSPTPQAAPLDPAAAPEATALPDLAPSAPGDADEGAAQPPAEAVSSTSGQAPVAAARGRKPAAPVRPVRAPRPGAATTKPGDLMSPY